MLVEIKRKDAVFQHYARILANPIKAAANPASAKIGKLKRMYRISNPKIDR